MTAPRLSASVIVTTRNRANDLRRILPSLLRLTYEPFEVIVVVGPSEDDTLDVVDEYRDRMKVVTSPVANMCRSRNIGIAHAAGDVIIFTDDDAMPETAEWLDAMMEPFASDPRVGAAGGPVLHRDGALYEFRHGVASPYGEHVFVASASLQRRPGWFPRAMGANSAFRREALLKIGGFDERIAYYGDECDVCYRLAQLGYEFVFAERAVVRHYPAPSANRHYIERTQTAAHDDTYACLRNGPAPWPLRLAITTWKAPRKHYVAEILAARRAGRLKPGEFGRFARLWWRGYRSAVAESLTTHRQLMRPADGETAGAPALLPLTGPRPAVRRSIIVTARTLACDGPCEGVARYAWDLAQALHALGHDVHVIGESAARVRHLALGLTVHGISSDDISSHPFAAQPMLDANVSYALAVADRVRALQQAGLTFDVVHTTNWNIEALGLILEQSIPVVMMLVTSTAEVADHERWARTDDVEALIWIERGLMRMTAALAAPTQGLVRKSVTAGHLDDASAGRVAIAPLGIVPRRTPASRGGEPKRLLFVGTHIRRKGLVDLLAVLPDVMRAHPDWVCDLAGDDTRIIDGVTLKDQFLREHAGEPWLSRVVFHGRVADRDLWALYASADLFVAPSRFESFGLIYLEAMQFGVPVVGTRVGGIPEVVRENETGVLVPPGDPAALGDALGRLMIDDDLRRRLGDAARADVQARWTHLHMAQRLLPLYEQVIGHAPRAAAASGEAVPTAESGEAILALLARAGAPQGLIARLRTTMRRDAANGEHHALLQAALGRLPQVALYIQAAEYALEHGDAPRAVRLVDDAYAHAPGLTAESMQTLTQLQALAMHLGGAGGASRPAESATNDNWQPRGVAQAPVADLIDEAMARLREGRVGDGMARLFALVDDRRLAAADRLSLSFHLASALKRSGFPSEAGRRLRAVTAAGGFSRLPVDVRSAAWFHLGDLARAAGRLDEAEEAFSRCLDINPGHGRAAALRTEMRGSLAPVATRR
jgi:glycogen synthase